MAKKKQDRKKHSAKEPLFNPQTGKFKGGSKEPPTKKMKAKATKSRVGGGKKGGKNIVSLTAAQLARKRRKR